MNSLIKILIIGKKCGARFENFDGTSMALHNVFFYELSVYNCAHQKQCFTFKSGYRFETFFIKCNQNLFLKILMVSLKKIIKMVNFCRL